MVVASKSKFSWRVAVESLVGRRAKALEGFDDLVERAARGESFSEADVERTLNLSGRSPDEFAEAVERKAERIRLAAEIERLESLAEQSHEAEMEERRIVTAHNERVAEMVAELQPKLLALRERQNSGVGGRSQADDLRRRLADSCDPGLFEQAKALQDELSEALAIQRNATDQYHDARALAESAENRGDARAEEFRQNAMGVQQWKGRADKRVAELQARAETVQAAMVSA
jgi:hypothetical protein